MRAPAASHPPGPVGTAVSLIRAVVLEECEGGGKAEWRLWREGWRKRTLSTGE